MEAVIILYLSERVKLCLDVGGFVNFFFVFLYIFLLFFDLKFSSSRV